MIETPTGPLITPVDGSHLIEFSPVSVCLSVCFFRHDISKTDAARITKLDIYTCRIVFQDMVYVFRWRLRGGCADGGR